jgi:ornithine lipid hydroxylase
VLGVSLWPSTWPLWGQLVMALIVAEFGYYWVHRLSHEVGWLWRFHAVHHSVSRLYWFNSGHFHPMDTLLNYSAEVVPLLLLGASPKVLVLFSVFTTMNGMLKHSNIDLRLGPLNWLLSTAELHRWHHSKEPTEGNTNYGSNLVLWDLVFGTRFLPDQKPPVDIGLSGVSDFPGSFVAQLRAPFSSSNV